MAPLSFQDQYGGCLQIAVMVVYPQRDELLKQGREGLPQGSQKSGVPSLYLGLQHAGSEDVLFRG